MKAAGAAPTAASAASVPQADGLWGVFGARVSGLGLLGFGVVGCRALRFFGL